LRAVLQADAPVEPDQGAAPDEGHDRRLPCGAHRRIAVKIINPLKFGAASAAALGGVHMLWAVLVAVGLGQPVLDFILRLHFILPALTVGPFDLATACGLVALTAALGFVAGYLLAICINSGLWDEPG
jgi:hypothetical protein